MQGQRSMDQNRNVEEVEVVEEGRREEGQGEGGRVEEGRVEGSAPATGLRRTTVKSHSDKVTNAEITWVLKMVESNLSYSSSEDLVEVLQRMAPDSMILKDMTLKRSKAMYVLCHGLYPYYLQQLVRRIKEAPAFTLGTDSATFKLHSLAKSWTS